MIDVDAINAALPEGCEVARTRITVQVRTPDGLAKVAGPNAEAIQAGVSDLAAKLKAAAEAKAAAKVETSE